MINPDRPNCNGYWETTGMNQIGAHYEGHCIIEIDAVEMINLNIRATIFTFILSQIVWLIPMPLKFTVLRMKCWRINRISKRLQQDFIEYIRRCQLLIHNATLRRGLLAEDSRRVNLG